MNRCICVSRYMYICAYIFVPALRTSANIQVHIADNGNDALEYLHKQCVNIIMMDLMMPGMDGIELCSQLKRLPQTSEIPIIAMTGYPTMENIDKVIEAGATAFMGKPLEPDTLRAILRDLTHGHTA